MIQTGFYRHFFFHPPIKDCKKMNFKHPWRPARRKDTPLLWDQFLCFKTWPPNLWHPTHQEIGPMSLPLESGLGDYSTDGVWKRHRGFQAKPLGNRSFSFLFPGTFTFGTQPHALRKPKQTRGEAHTEKNQQPGQLASLRNEPSWKWIFQPSRWLSHLSWYHVEQTDVSCTYWALPKWQALEQNKGLSLFKPLSFRMVCYTAIVRRIGSLISIICSGYKATCSHR